MTQKSHYAKTKNNNYEHFKFKSLLPNIPSCDLHSNISGENYTELPTFSTTHSDY